LGGLRLPLLFLLSTTAKHRAACCRLPPPAVSVAAYRITPRCPARAAHRAGAAATRAAPPPLAALLPRLRLAGWLGSRRFGFCPAGALSATRCHALPHWLFSLPAYRSIFYSFLSLLCLFAALPQTFCYMPSATNDIPCLAPAVHSRGSAGTVCARTWTVLRMPTHCCNCTILPAPYAQVLRYTCCSRVDRHLLLRPFSSCCPPRTYTLPHFCRCTTTRSGCGFLREELAAGLTCCLLPRLLLLTSLPP